MSETKHTPGPWEFLPEVGRVEGGVTGKSPVAFIAGALGWQKFGKYPMEEAKANGRLIAAAPEILEALQKSVNTTTEAYSCLRNYVGHAADCQYHRTDSPHGDVCVCDVEQRVLKIRVLISKTNSEAEAAIRKAKGE